jgi:hypothetical protein
MGGRLEIIGAMIHPRNIGVPEDMRVITNDQADISFVGREANSNSTSYKVLAEVRRGNEIRTLEVLGDGVPLAVKGIDYSFVLPLFVERGAAASPVRGGLASRYLSQDTIRIDWDPVNGANNYRIYRDLSWAGSGRDLAGETAATTFLDTGLPVGSQFWYWIEPVIGATPGALSSAIPGITARGLPSPPEQLAATYGTYPDRIVVQWEPVQGADFSYIWRNTSTDPGTATRLTTITENTTTEYVDQTVESGQVYYYWIQPFAFGFGFGGFGDPVGGLAGSPVSWAGYPYADAQGHVDTGDFLGWLQVIEPFVYSFELQHWLYLPQAHVSDSGAWVYVYR